MSSQINLFKATLPQARAEANDAIQRVEAAADQSWREQAFDAVIATCRQLPEFISDDIWKVGELPNTREDRALGAVIRRAAKAGLCRKTDRVRPSARSHGSGKPVWKSMVYGGVR